MNFHQFIPTQSIFIQDEYGCLFSVPLLTTEIVRQVLRCHIRNDTYRDRIEQALIRRYFPMSVGNSESDIRLVSQVRVPVTPRVVVDDAPPVSKVRVVEDLPPVERVVHDIKKVKVEAEVSVKVEMPTSQVPENNFQQVSREFLERNGGEGESEEDVPSQPDPIIKVEANVTVQLQQPIAVPVVSALEVKKEAEDWRGLRDVPLPDRGEKNDSIVFRDKKHRRVVPIFAGQLKNMKCYDIRSIRVELDGEFRDGKIEVITRRDNGPNEVWETLYSRDVQCALKFKTIVSIRNDDPVPSKVNVKGHIIRQMSVVVSLDGIVGRTVKVRIKYDALLLALVYSHFGSDRGGKKKKKM